ncbi:MAG: hypothetical protein M1829_003904 [Trizodia sp. TS-e1964]|nr:MAG: hypothetical protein M1829_003904 [Trizodia sp. TS-e1964]
MASSYPAAGPRSSPISSFARSFERLLTMGSELSSAREPAARQNRLTKPRTNSSSNMLALVACQAERPSSAEPPPKASVAPAERGAVAVSGDGHRRSRQDARQKLRLHLFEDGNEGAKGPHADVSHGGVYGMEDALSSPISSCGSPVSRMPSARVSSALLLQAPSSSRLSLLVESAPQDPPLLSREAISVQAQASMDELALYNSPHSPMDEISAPIRRRSLLTPGIATRGNGVLRKPLPRESTSGLGFCAIQAPTPLKPMEIRSEEPARPFTRDRNATPSEVEYSHLGGFKPGTLRIMNGTSSPAPSGKSNVRPSTSPRTKSSNYGEDAGTEPNELEDMEETIPTPWGKTYQVNGVFDEASLFGNVQAQEPLLSPAASELSFEMEKNEFEASEQKTSPPSLRQSLALFDFSSPSPPRRSPDRASAIAVAYMRELSDSPYCGLSCRPESREGFLATSKVNEFDDALFEDDDLYTPSEPGSQLLLESDVSIYEEVADVISISRQNTLHILDGEASPSISALPAWAPLTVKTEFLSLLMDNQSIAETKPLAKADSGYSSKSSSKSTTQVSGVETSPIDFTEKPDHLELSPHRQRVYKDHLNKSLPSFPTDEPLKIPRKSSRRQTTPYLPSTEGSSPPDSILCSRRRGSAPPPSRAPPPIPAELEPLNLTTSSNIPVQKPRKASSSVLRKEYRRSAPARSHHIPTAGSKTPPLSTLAAPKQVTKENLSPKNVRGRIRETLNFSFNKHQSHLSDQKADNLSSPALSRKLHKRRHSSPQPLSTMDACRGLSESQIPRVPSMLRIRNSQRVPVYTTLKENFPILSQACFSETLTTPPRPNSTLFRFPDSEEPSQGRNSIDPESHIDGLRQHPVEVEDMSSPPPTTQPTTQQTYRHRTSPPLPRQQSAPNALLDEEFENHITSVDTVSRGLGFGPYNPNLLNEDTINRSNIKDRRMHRMKPKIGMGEVEASAYARARSEDWIPSLASQSTVGQNFCNNYAHDPYDNVQIQHNTQQYYSSSYSGNNAYFPLHRRQLASTPELYETEFTPMPTRRTVNMLSSPSNGIHQRAWHQRSQSAGNTFLNQGLDYQNDYDPDQRRFALEQNRKYLASSRAYEKNGPYQPINRTPPSHFRGGAELPFHNLIHGGLGVGRGFAGSHYDYVEV